MIIDDQEVASRPHLLGQCKVPRTGDIVEGVILSKHGSSVFIDLGYGTGIIYGKEYQDGREMLKQKEIGDMVVTKIIELENEDGYVELSVKEAGREKFSSSIIFVTTMSPISF